MHEKLFTGESKKDGFYVSRENSDSVATLERILAGVENPKKNTECLSVVSPELLMTKYRVKLLRELIKSNRINFWNIRKELKKEDPANYNAEVFRKACVRILADLDILQ